MDDPTDILFRLRLSSRTMDRDAADEIERLRAELEAWEEIAEVHLQDAQSLRAENAALREQHRQAHENAAALHGALADISTLTPLGGEVADPADVVAAVRALREDAERWRLARKWFRVMSPHIDGNHGWCPTGEWGRIKGPNIDTAIDEAMRKNAL